MKNYDFNNLSPIDFEILVRDLLQKELKVRLESFKPGKDSGIDFRYSEQKSRKWIIQAKQFCNSPVSTLLKELERESVKVKKLSPSRYIVVTALGLTPDNKEKTLNIFTPFITSTKDIYDKEDLNNLLTLFPEVERQTFKLWLPSVEVLEEILHSGIKNVSRDTLEKIQENAKVYVQNDSFVEALDKLSKHNICIVAGIPGIGKTTLADMLILPRVKNLGPEFHK